MEVLIGVKGYGVLGVLILDISIPRPHGAGLEFEIFVRDLVLWLFLSNTRSVLVALLKVLVRDFCGILVCLAGRRREIQPEPVEPGPFGRRCF